MEYIHDGDLEKHISSISNTHELCSLLVQIMYCFIELGQKYKIYHGDIHSANILIDKTEEKYSTHVIHGEERKLKTFGKIPKLIDFGRSGKYYGESPTDVEIIYELMISMSVCIPYINNKSIKQKINSILSKQETEYASIDDFVNKIMDTMK